MKQQKPILTAVLFTAISSAVFAQSSIVVTGGDAIGSGGSVSYSVGQIADTTTAGPNGSAAQGVQQPIELLMVGVDNYPAITLSASVYPNPTKANVILRIDLQNSDNLFFQLYDLNGKLIASQKISSSTTSIATESLAAGGYFLKVIGNNTELKTFKIIKNN
jgi:hypothetical protein